MEGIKLEGEARRCRRVGNGAGVGVEPLVSKAIAYGIEYRKGGCSGGWR